MNTNVIEMGINLYLNSPSVFFALSSSIIILTFALLMSNRLQNDHMRIVLIVVPIALGTYLMSLSVDGTERDFFQNLSTEFIGALLALALFADWVITNQYTFPIVAIAIFVVSGVFVWQGAITSDGFYINLSTELIGALITTAVIRREWLWTGHHRLPHDERHAYFQARRRHLEFDTARRMCDLEFHVRGRNPEANTQYIQSLLGAVEILAEERDRRQPDGRYQRTVYANCRSNHYDSLSPDYLTIILDGHRQAVEQTIPRLRDTFQVRHEDSTPSSLTDVRARLSASVVTPSQSLEEELSQMVNMFIERWQASARLPRSNQEYADGYHDAITYACDDLRQALDAI